MEQALAALAADWTVVIRDHYCADPHLEGADLRVVALVEASVGKGAQGSEEAQMQAIRDIEATWHEWLGEYMAYHLIWAEPRPRPGWCAVASRVLRRTISLAATTRAWRFAFPCSISSRWGRAAALPGWTMVGPARRSAQRWRRARTSVLWLGWDRPNDHRRQRRPRPARARAIPGW